MRHSIELQHDERLLVATLEGEASREGLMRYIGDMLKPPYLDLDLPVLTDMRQLDVRHLAGDHIKELVQMVCDHRHLLKPVRNAFVVSSQAAFGFARMYELMSQDAIPLMYGSFYDYDEALAWVLDRDPVLS